MMFTSSAKSLCIIVLPTTDPVSLSITFLFLPPSLIFFAHFLNPRYDDPHKIVKVISQGHWKRFLRYRFPSKARIKEDDDIAIKNVLQDERFKVHSHTRIDGMTSTYCITLYAIVKGYCLVNIIFYILTYKLTYIRVELQHGTRNGHIGENEAFTFEKKRD